MTVHAIACPSCSAPLTVPSDGRYIRCSYCTATLRIEQSGNQILLLLGDKVVTTIQDTSARIQTTIQAGSQLTQLELRRLQLSQDFATAQLQLSHLQTEIRTLERQTPDRKIQQQLRDLRTEETSIKQRMRTLQDALNPPPPPPPAATPLRGVSNRTQEATKPSATATDANRNEFFWLIFSLNGRISRRQFWFAGVAAFSIIAVATAPAPEGSAWAGIMFLLGCWVALALGVKRFHDRNKPGWWVLLALIPGIGILWLLVELGFFPGTPAPNRFNT